MKFRALTSYILLAIFLFLLLSTLVQAGEYKEIREGNLVKKRISSGNVLIDEKPTEYSEVKAEEIIKKIENSEDVNLTNCRIIGELNVNNIKLGSASNPAFNKSLNSNIINDNKKLFCEISENSSIIDSNITIKNSVFENSINFSNVNFKNHVSFEGTTFNEVNFKGASFSNPVNFCRTDFNKSANFMFVNFFYYANFDEASFKNPVYFESANFGNYINYNYSSTDMFDNEIPRYSSFMYANFGDSAYFDGVNFRGYTDFYDSHFGDFASFIETRFDDSVSFSYTNFDNSANFHNTNFGNCARFSGVYFGKYADFRLANFTVTTEFYVPETSDKIVTDGKTCKFFMDYYESESRYTDADNIYYNYRKYSQNDKSLTSFSKWFDIFSWITCGYGLRPFRIFYFGGIVVLFFSIIYEKGHGICISSGENEQNSTVSFWDALYFSIITFTTVGSGNLYAKRNYRKWVTLEGLLGWIVLGVFMATLTNVMIRS